MKNKILTMIGGMTLMFCAISATSEACVTVTSQDTYTVDESGCTEY